MRNLIVILCAVALASCGITTGVLTPPESPGAVADRTKLDEQAGITVTLAYTAAAKAAALAIRTADAIGHPLPAATVQRIGALDAQAYAAVQAVRQAYLTANAASYAAAIAQANAVIGNLLAAASSPTAMRTPTGAAITAGRA
jgi:hypothetical protein